MFQLSKGKGYNNQILCLFWMVLGELLHELYKKLNLSCNLFPCFFFLIPVGAHTRKLSENIAEILNSFGISLLLPFTTELQN